VYENESRWQRLGQRAACRTFILHEIVSDLELTIKYIHSRVYSRRRRKLIAVFLNIALLALMAVPSQAGLRVVAYYPSWLKTKYPCTQIDYSQMTHIAQAFVWLNTNGTLDVTGDWSFYPELVKEAHAHGVKIVVSVGGGGRGAGNFGAMANDAVARSNFVQRLTSFCTSNNYDGADIDWESPSNVNDMANFTTLLKELRASFTTASPNWTLSAAVRSRPWAGRWLDIDRIKELLDWVGVMTYDYHGPWTGHSGFNAPLYGADSDPCGLSDCVDGSVQYYLSRNLPKDKLLVGLPFYGYQFCSKKLYATNTAGIELTYADAMQRISNGWTRVWDNTSRVPYVVDSDHTLMASYEDPMSISNKCDYVVANGLGGVIIWSLGLDSYAGKTPLLDVVGSSLLTPANTRQQRAHQ
jgi:chitinase